MQISQPPMVQIGKFQCLSHRAFPEFFKTHPTLICRSFVKASRSLQTNRQCYLIALVVSKGSFRSVDRIVKSSVVSVHPYFPDWVANPCVGLSRILNRLTKDIQGLHSGPIYHIGLSALTIHRAQAFSLFPCCTITGQGFMLILIFIL